jgi:hypothetical protein
MKKWPRKWYWIAILILLSISLYTAWHLQLNPQYVPLFLATTIIAMGFVVVMALLPKYRQQLVKKVLAYHAKAQKRGGLLYRYGRIFNAVMITVLLVFSLVVTNNPEILGIPYIPYLVIALFIVFLISAAVFIYGFLRVAGKWVLLLIAIGTAIAILRLLTWSR